MGSHENSRNQEEVTDGFPCMISGHRTEKLFSMGFEILGLILVQNTTYIYILKCTYLYLPWMFLRCHSSHFRQAV